MQAIRVLCALLIAAGAYGQETLDITIGGRPVHLKRRIEMVALRIVKESAAIAANRNFASAFQIYRTRNEAAGLLAIAKSAVSSGAMPAGTLVYKTSNQVQQIPVFASNSSAVDIALFPELIVQFKEGVDDATARQRLRIYGAQDVRATPVRGRYVAAMPHPQAVIAATNNMPRYVKELAYTEPNFYFISRSNGLRLRAEPSRPAGPHASGTIGDPEFANQWTLATTPIDFGVVRAWDTFQAKGDNVKVAVVDDGVDLAHEDLKDAITAFWDTTVAPATGTTTQAPYTLQPEAQHGTACAGIIGARLNDVGIAGVAPNSKLIAIKAATWATVDGEPRWVNNTTALADAIDKAVALGADIISASWGIPEGIPSADISAAIDRALASANQRLVLLFAAGNLMDSDTDRTLSMDFPASLSATKPGVIAVSASSPCDTMKSFDSCDNDPSWASKYLPRPTILAPGTNMETTVPGNLYATFSGTSAATPFAAGAIALLMSKEPALTRAQILERLPRFSKILTLPGTGPFTRVDAFCLLSGNAPCAK
jgi:subtilisin family serine protease